jgi:23S rRNA (uracil1939-C5)-methyltransferase
MARDEIFCSKIERLVTGGAGLTRSKNGKTVFIDLTAKGDKIKWRIKKERKNWAEGELLEILEPSPDRIKPVCPYFGQCGGCSFQHLNYEAQIEAKTQILLDSLRRIGKITPPEIHVQKSIPFEYRNRFRFHKAKFKEEPLCLKKRNSNDLVEISDCPVADTGIRKALQEKRIKTPQDKEMFNVFSKGECFLCSGGTKKGKVSVLGRELLMDVELFFQSNVLMLELLIKDLALLTSASDFSLPLSDVYCGVGTFAAFLGQDFAFINLVEENKAALTIAFENMPQGKKVNYFANRDSAWANSQSELNGFLILDPPREGLSIPFRKYLAEKGPETIAYVSCDPAVLARDSRNLLIDGGYILKELKFFDFYPQTAHIESLAVFRRSFLPIVDKPVI